MRQGDKGGHFRIYLSLFRLYHGLNIVCFIMKSRQRRGRGILGKVENLQEMEWGSFLWSNGGDRTEVSRQEQDPRDCQENKLFCPREFQLRKQLSMLSLV